jgi:DNA polymerase-3 subunit delta
MTTCVIFTGSKIDQRKKFFTELKKKAAMVEYKRLYDNKLNSFIMSEAASQGKSIESAAADLLAFLIGNNLQELSSQVEKLIIYSGSRSRIQMDDVKVIASDSKAFSVFELARFMGTKDLQNALKSLNTLFRNGEEVPMMVGALSRHFRQLWRVRELLDNRAPQAEISKEAGIAPYFVGEMITQARNFDRQQLSSVFEKLCQCDIASKTGGHPYTLMHGLVTGICT